MTGLVGRLPLLVAVAAVFLVSFAAASQLQVTITAPPAAFTGQAATCQQDPVTVGYAVTDGTVRSLELAGLDPDCNGVARVTVEMAASYLPASATRYSTDMTSGTALSIPLEDATSGTGIAFTDYSTGSISIYVLPKTGVGGAP